MAPNTIQIRPFVAADAPTLGRLMAAAIQQGTQAYYDADQRNAWVANAPAGAAWLDRLTQVTTLIAQDSQGPAGFMTLDTTGYIDLAYVRPDRLGQGVARQLYVAIEALARRQSIRRLTSHASEMARQFFTKQGWQVVAPQLVVVANVEMSNYKMMKMLEP